ncbi:hypothetical protein Patl1_28970 [Pistacia atlantica]|uniref:Uncharacterized protein n=1 Tax=Pistacia atlantica TaxID=434234 RepID=A0ACC1BDL2_9ROSI|nr:hypothetical protein Patl1_28970 [Pistacia atlantica]
MFEVNSQLKELVKAGHLKDARKMFDKMPHRDEISWTTVISGYVKAMDSTEALVLFSRMWVEPEMNMDPFVLSLGIKACAQNVNVNFGESLHGFTVKTGLVNSVFVGSALVDMYTKIGKGLVRAGYNSEGLVYFSEMWRSKVECDSYTFAIALKACADSSALNYGREIHNHTIKRGFDMSSFVANSLATMYNKCGKIDYGLCVCLKE